MEIIDIEKLKHKVKISVNSIDPWSLIEMGAPEDEYNSQTDRIVSILINQKPDRISLENELFEIFRTKEFELEKDKIIQLVDKLLLS